MRHLNDFLTDETGAAAAEYALVLAIVVAVLAVVFSNLGAAIANSVDNVASYMALPAS